MRRCPALLRRTHAAERFRSFLSTPIPPLHFAQADEGWSNDGLETIDLTGHVLRAPQTISRPAADDLYNRTPDGMA